MIACHLSDLLQRAQTGPSELRAASAAVIDSDPPPKQRTEPVHDQACDEDLGEVVPLGVFDPIEDYG
jgi:hypothetical protein